MGLVFSDLQGMVSLVADGALVATLFFLIYQIQLQRREANYRIYEKLMSDFSQSALLLVIHPELAKTVNVGRNKPLKWDDYEDNQKQLYSYLDALFGLFERVWVAQNVAKIRKNEWGRWRNWLKILASNSIFTDVFDFNRYLYDSSFMQEIQCIINEVDQENKTSSSNTNT